MPKTMKQVSDKMVMRRRDVHTDALLDEHQVAIFYTIKDDGAGALQVVHAFGPWEAPDLEWKVEKEVPISRQRFVDAREREDYVRELGEEIQDEMSGVVGGMDLEWGRSGLRRQPGLITVKEHDFDLSEETVKRRISEALRDRLEDRLLSEDELGQVAF